MDWFSVDGVAWTVPCSIQRSTNIEETKISGWMMDDTYFSDVRGTYYPYTVKIAVPRGQTDVYSALFEILSQPVDGHEFVFPYNEGLITITARVRGLKDTYISRVNDADVRQNEWKGISFQALPNHPSKFLSLGEVLTRGRTPIPPQTTYPDADERYY